MKIFYDNTGRVIGQVEGATPEIESEMSMPGLNEMTANQNLRDVLSDPYTSLYHNDLEVRDGEVILKDFGISLSEAPQPLEPSPQDETPQP